MPNSNPHSDFLILSDQLNYRLFYPTPLRVSFWLRFRFDLTPLVVFTARLQRQSMLDAMIT